MLDRFELIAEIASGGMATVFLARLEGVAGFQRLYAIKRLHPHLANEGEFVDMFLDEARLAARIHHPNVVPILEVGMSEQGYYLVMEYIEGDTAARLLARASQTGGRLPPSAAIRIALDTLAGLHAAHELTDDEGRPLHIVHRDVSPQNVLVGIDGTSRITDFGVAHAATRLSSTRTGQLKGKLAYMAPEQSRGAAVDRRSDVFAMGVVLWEMLAGKRLFKGGNDAETLHRILFAPIPTLRGSGVPLPLPLDTVCMKALEREPENRYASAAEFADELERVARSLGILSTTRDIATYVDGSIGAEISQQREVVRMWLSRSEPSRNDRPGPLAPEDRRSGRALPEAATSSSDVSGGRPSRRASAREETLAAPPSHPLLPVATKPGDVSSVSSAVLQVSGPTSDSSVLSPPDGMALRPSVPARLAWVAGAVALVTAATIGIVVLTRASHDQPAPSADFTSGNGPPMQAGAGVPTRPPPAAPSATVTTPPASRAATVDAGASPRPARPVSPIRPALGGRPGRGTGAPLPPSDDPDDLSRNPYR